LLVEDVISADGGKFAPIWRLPFRVASKNVPSAPYGKVLLHQTITQLQTSKMQYTVSKLKDPKNGRRYSVAFDKYGKEADLEKLVVKERNALIKKFGKLHPTLYDSITTGKPKAAVPVAIWLNIEERRTDKAKFDLDPCGEVPEELIAYRLQNKRAQETYARILRSEYGLKEVRALNGGPVLIAKLSTKQIRLIERNEAVSALFLYEAEGIVDIFDSLAVSHADDVIGAGFRGTGVRVAVWEDGPDDTTELSIAGRFTTSPTPSWHARMVTGTIKYRSRSLNPYDVRWRKPFRGYRLGTL
jgi:hypothetical protein